MNRYIMMRAIMFDYVVIKRGVEVGKGTVTFFRGAPHGDLFAQGLRNLRKKYRNCTVRGNNIQSLN